MNVTVKLGSAIIRFRPEHLSSNPFELSVDEGCTVSDVVTTLGMPKDFRLMSILNDTLISPADRAETYLSDSDTLALMPPIQAG